MILIICDRGITDELWIVPSINMARQQLRGHQKVTKNGNGMKNIRVR